MEFCWSAAVGTLVHAGEEGETYDGEDLPCRTLLCASVDLATLSETQARGVPGPLHCGRTRAVGSTRVL